jgi:hypothetical protein
MGHFRLKLGLCGGARQGPGQELGPLLAHCTRRDVKGAIFMKMDDIRPKMLEQKRRENNQKQPKCPGIYEVVWAVGIIIHGSGRHGGT